MDVSEAALHFYELFGRRLEQQVGQLDKRVDHLDKKVGQLDQRVDRLEQKVGEIKLSLIKHDWMLNTAIMGISAIIVLLLIMMLKFKA